MNTVDINILIYVNDPCDTEPPIAAIIIHNLPNDVVNCIKAISAAKGHAMEQEIRELIEVYYAAQRIRQRWQTLPSNYTGRNQLLAHHRLTVMIIDTMLFAYAPLNVEGKAEEAVHVINQTPC